MIINGKDRNIGLDELRGKPFKARPRTAPVTQVVVHESVTADHAISTDADATERILRRRGLGVHLMIAPTADGKAATLVQHNDLIADRLSHASGLNTRSIAVEMVSPYYPRFAKPPWGPKIKASWAHQGEYLLPPLAQVERLWNVVLALISQELLQLLWPGSRDGEAPVLGRLRKPDLLAPGIWAHHYAAHADGAWPVLYCWLRAQGREAGDAYARAILIGEDD